MMRPWTIVKDGSGWLLPLSGRQVDRCTLDYRFGLNFYGGDDEAAIIVEGAFRLLDNEDVLEMDATQPAELGPAFALVRRVVRTARATETGRLEVLFEDGSRLIVEPNEQFEAWEMYGPGGIRAICMPGGDIAIWNAEGA
jgi:hypothetical protein